MTRYLETGKPAAPRTRVKVPDQGVVTIVLSRKKVARIKELQKRKAARRQCR